MTAKKRNIERERLKRFTSLEIDDHPEKTGVLLSDEIEHYVNTGQIITPFQMDNLKPAAYELTVGDEAMLGGQYLSLGDSTENGKLIIPQFEVAVIKTAETLNLPRFLIARWNIRVLWAYRGLLWVGGPQVDPGFVGHLFCPIYNLSNKEVLIRKGDAIAVMDFVKTTAFDRDWGEESYRRYGRPPKRLIIDDYEIDEFQSALREQAEAIPKLEKSVAAGKRALDDGLKEVRSSVSFFTTLVFAILAILMGAIMLPYFGQEEKRAYVHLWDGLPILFAVVALIISAWNLFRHDRSVRWNGWRILVGSAAVSALSAYLMVKYLT